MTGPSAAGAALGVIALLATGACRRAEPPANTAVDVIAATSPSPAAIATPIAKSNSGSSLGSYIGKYPFDAVGGISFLDDPVVTAAVATLIGDPHIRAEVLGDDGPGTPITMRDGKLVAWGCRTHDCGDHNWTILIAPDGSAARVCYHDSAMMDGRARWYLAPGQAELRPGDCPSA